MQENCITVNSTRQNARKLYYSELSKTKCKKTVLRWTQQDKIQEKSASVKKETKSLKGFKFHTFTGRF